MFDTKKFEHLDFTKLDDVELIACRCLLLKACEKPTSETSITIDDQFNTFRDKLNMENLTVGVNDALAIFLLIANEMSNRYMKSIIG